MTSGSVPGGPQTMRLIGIGYGSRDSTVPVTDLYVLRSSQSAYCGSYTTCVYPAGTSISGPPSSAVNACAAARRTAVVDGGLAGPADLVRRQRVLRIHERVDVVLVHHLLDHELQHDAHLEIAHLALVRPQVLHADRVLGRQRWSSSSHFAFATNAPQSVIRVSPRSRKVLVHGERALEVVETAADAPQVELSGDNGALPIASATA